MFENIEKKFYIQSSQYFIQFCILPRVTMDPAEALYCAKFIDMIHQLKKVSIVKIIENIHSVKKNNNSNLKKKRKKKLIKDIFDECYYFKKKMKETMNKNNILNNLNFFLYASN